MLHIIETVNQTFFHFMALMAFLRLS